MCWITLGDGFPLFNKVGDESQSSKEQSRLPVSHLARRRLVNAEDTTLKSGMKVGSSTAELGFTRHFIQKLGSKLSKFKGDRGVAKLIEIVHELY